MPSENSKRVGKLPAAELEKFVRDTDHDPRGRRLAYELLAGIDPTAPDRLIPGMLHDPGVPFRRDAVSRLVEAAAKSLIADAKEDARNCSSRPSPGAATKTRSRRSRNNSKDLAKRWIYRGISASS